MARPLKLMLLVTATCLINTAMLAVFFGDKSVHGTGTVTDNGDVNGDRSVDIGDALYLLNFLFSGGPAPAVIAGGTALTPEQEEILSHMSIVQLSDGQGGTAKTIRFDSVNVQIVNGLDATNGNPSNPTSTSNFVVQTNSLGNLIVGYNEELATGNDRTGSHNIVMGQQNNYSSYGGSVGGRVNSIESGFCVVTSGTENRASEVGAVVTGGSENHASGDDSVVTAGQLNQASGDSSCVTAGRDNEANDFCAWVGAGQQNLAANNYSAIIAGLNNVTNAFRGVIVCGADNVVDGTDTVVVGGRLNTASDLQSCVVGGFMNQATDNTAVVGGGRLNVASGSSAVVGGGSNNTASGFDSTVSGGSTRSATGSFDWVAGSLFESL